MAGKTTTTATVAATERRIALCHPCVAGRSQTGHARRDSSVTPASWARLNARTSTLFWSQIRTPPSWPAFANLVWAQSLWAGVEKLIEPARTLNLQVARLIDPNLGAAMAEAALTWTLYLHRRIPDYAAAQRRQRWQALPWQPAESCRVTVLGMGELGRQSAARLAG